MIVLQTAKATEDTQPEFISLSLNDLDKVKDHTFVSIALVYSLNDDITGIAEALQALATERNVPFGTMELAPSGT